MNAPEFGQGNFHIWKQFLIMCTSQLPSHSPHHTDDSSPGIGSDHLLLARDGTKRRAPHHVTTAVGADTEAPGLVGEVEEERREDREAD